MIYDKIENLNRYKSLKKIEGFDISKYQKGKFDISNDVFFGIGLEYETKNETECLWEAHKKYLDIHYIIEGEEIIDIAQTDTMSPTMAFDYKNDYQLFEGKKQQSIILRKGDFLALYPNECHKTAIKITTPTSVKKIVFKIML